MKKNFQINKTFFFKFEYLKKKKTFSLRLKFSQLLRNRQAIIRTTIKNIKKKDWLSERN